VPKKADAEGSARNCQRAFGAKGGSVQTVAQARRRAAALNRHREDAP
jgi:hypothetical protein